MKELVRIAATVFFGLVVRLFIQRLELPPFKKILVLAPHPDDEIFGLGGSLFQFKKSGASINIIYITDGEGSAVWPDKEVIKRKRLILSEKACEELNISPETIFRMHLPDGNVPRHGKNRFDEAMDTIRALIDTIRPDAVFATHTLDYWPYDHVAVAEIALEAVKQSKHGTQLYYYWVWAWYNLRPFKTFRKLEKIDIRDQLNNKKKLMNIYLNSLTPDGKPWSGILPPSLLKAFEFPFEVVERII